MEDQNAKMDKEEIIVSVIMPIFNAKEYLEDSLNCIQKQTIKEIEIICVDDGSTDGTLDILESYQRDDPRIRILHQENKGAGAARNRGIAAAQGKYTYFFDADDICENNLLEKCVDRAQETNADIVAFDFTRFFEDGNEVKAKGIHVEWLPQECEFFNWTDCPDTIMSIVNPVPWNKLYRTEFIHRNDLFFEEISTTNDITFCAISVVKAERITFLTSFLVHYRVGHGNTITSKKKKNYRNIITAVTSAEKQAKTLSYYDKIDKSVCRFMIENYIYGLNYFGRDYEYEGFQEYYDFIHSEFNRTEFEGIHLNDIPYEALYQKFRGIRNNNYKEYKEKMQTKIIVSLTSYPARIQGVSEILKTIYAQSHMADKVILWLAEGQFPKREQELPEELRLLEEQGKLDIRWVLEDLRPHKKYFWALQEYPDAIVITIDDDLLYPEDMIESLLDSYLIYPKAVSAMRGHLILVNEHDEIEPYNNWLKEVDGCRYKPYMQILSTNGAGSLFPPFVMRDNLLFDSVAIKDNCIDADDLWLKAMQVCEGVPVVIAHKHCNLKYLPGTQEDALYHKNVTENKNDEQFTKIIQWYDEKYGKKSFIERLVGYSDMENGIERLSLSTIYSVFNAERAQILQQKRVLQNRLQMAFLQKSEINSKLQRTYDEKRDRGVKIKQLEREKRERGLTIKALKKEISEKDKRIEKLKNELDSIKNSRTYRWARKLATPIRALKTGRYRSS